MNTIKYFDNCATSKISDSVLDCMHQAERDCYFNPSALYNAAASVSAKKEAARATVAKFMGADPAEIYFTSGGTESNNTALFGAAKGKRGNIITTKVEHASVYYPVAELKNRGFDVKYAPVRSDGTVSEETISALADSETAMVALMHVNNETGGINDIKKLCAAAKKINPKCLFVCDGVQAFGKIPVNVKNLGVDFYSVSAHKIYGPKGVGALYVKKGVGISPLIYGGGQESKLRSGTENIVGILGFAAAVDGVKDRMKDYADRYIYFKRILNNIITDKVTDFVVFPAETTTPNIFTVIFRDIKAEVILHMLEDKNIIVGNGSACSSKSMVSRVAEGIGLPRNYAEGMIRISFGSDNTDADVALLGESLCEAVNTLRKLTRRSK